MTYNGKEIDTPTIDMFEEYVNKKGYKFNATDVYSYYLKRGWKTKKGTLAKSVEVLCDVWNGLPEKWQEKNKIKAIETKTPNSSLQTNIDWEQRRYELAKEIYLASLKDLWDKGFKATEEVSGESVYLADLLIENLK